MVLNNITNMLYNTYAPDSKHFDKTWKDPNGTTITEKGFITTSEAWSPGVLILCYVGVGLCLSTCIVSLALYFIYEGDVFAAFRNEGADGDNF